MRTVFNRASPEDLDLLRTLVEIILVCAVTAFFVYIGIPLNVAIVLAAVLMVWCKLLDIEHTLKKQHAAIRDELKQLHPNRDEATNFDQSKWAREELKRLRQVDKK